MDKNTCKMLREKIQAALDAHPIEGFSITAGNMRFDTHGATLKVEIREKVAGTVISKERQILLSVPDGSTWGIGMPIRVFTKSDAGRKFRLAGHDYELEGLLPRSQKFPVLARRASDGKLYKLSAEAVAGALKALDAAGKPET